MFDINLDDYKPEATQDPIRAMHEAIKDTGLKPPVFLQPNVINRFQDKEDKAGKLSGWCWYTSFDGDYGKIFVAKFGTWRNSDLVHTWCSHKTSSLSRDEMRQLSEQMAASEEAAKKAREKKQIEAQVEVKRTILSISDSNGDHPYLVRKGIKAYKNVKSQGEDIIIPIYIEGDMWSYQRIGPNGNKKFKTGGKIKGGYFTIDGDDTIVICEGYATGASIREATGHTVIVAFNAGNLYDVAMYWKSKATGEIIIAGDDDRFNEVNVGKQKANAAATAIGCRVVFPTFKEDDKGTDFNDMDQSLVKGVFKKEKSQNPIKKNEVQNAAIPLGVISDIYNYYRATDGYDQEQFALNTALAIASVVCGRNFQTDERNFTSLYFMNIGNAGTGKEHCKTVIEEIMRVCGQKIVMGDGFTSAGAVFSALIMKPRFISVIDELGMYLKAGMQNNANQVEANSTIMQCFGRCHSTLRPKNYSAMTMTKKQKEDMESREIENPAITLVGITTPSTVFECLSHKDILSGLISRFIMYVSDMPISVRRRVPILPVPDSIVSWIGAISNRAKDNGNTVDISSQQPIIETIPFSEAARDIHDEFAIWVAKELNIALEHNLEGVGVRVNEISMRLALICALSRNPHTKIIADVDSKWATEFMREKYISTMKLVKKYMTASTIDADLKDMVREIAKFGPRGVKRSELLKNIPIFRKYKLHELENILETAIEAGIVIKENLGSGGRPVVVYIASMSE